MSGGGLDYAGLDISNQDFSNGNYKGKDFTQVSECPRDRNISSDFEDMHQSYLMFLLIMNNLCINVLSYKQTDYRQGSYIC